MRSARPAAPPRRSSGRRTLRSRTCGAATPSRASWASRCSRSSSRTRSSCSPRRSPACASRGVGGASRFRAGVQRLFRLGVRRAPVDCRPRPSRWVARPRTHALRAVADGDHRPAGVRARSARAVRARVVLRAERGSHHPPRAPYQAVALHARSALHRARVPKAPSARSWRRSWCSPCSP